MLNSAKHLQGLRVFQNNKALKLLYLQGGLTFRLRVFQNNKALKLIHQPITVRSSLRVFQNNKALKPQIRLKAARWLAVILFYAFILALFIYIFNYFA